MRNEQLADIIVEQLESNIKDIINELNLQVNSLLDSSRRIDISCRRLRTTGIDDDCLKRTEFLVKLEKLESTILLLEAAKKFAIELCDEDLTDSITNIILEVRGDIMELKRKRTQNSGQ